MRAIRAAIIQKLRSGSVVLRHGYSRLRPHSGFVGGARSRDIVERLIDRARQRTELGFGVVRIVFALFMLWHFVVCNDLHGPLGQARAMFEFPATLAAVMLSLPIMVRASRGRLKPWVIDASVVLDAIVANTTLLAGVLEPWPSYAGLLRTPDIAVIPVLCVAAGLRLSVRATLLGAGVNALGFVSLAALDEHLNPQLTLYVQSESELFGLYMFGALTLGLILASRARSIAEAAAEHALRADAARDGLTQVLQDRHDTASLLSSAQINADLLARILHCGREPAGLERVAALQQNLAELSKLVRHSRDRSYLELATSAALDVADPIEVARDLFASLAWRFQNVRFELQASRSVPALLIVGGEEGLKRVLLNLLVNAAEGDGTRAATRVVLEVQASGAQVTLAIIDNGPGFARQPLRQGLVSVGSTKVHGAGLGLLLAEGLIVTSGGTMQLVPCAHGALIRITLPRSDRASMDPTPTLDRRSR